MKYFLMLFCWVVLGTGGWAAGEVPVFRPVGNSGVKVAYLATYEVDRLNQILTTELVEEGFSKKVERRYPPAVCAVKLYRVTYPSVIPEQGDRPTIASGLVAIPEKRKEPAPLISYQHGTVFTKTQVPSFPDESMETRLMIAQFAGQGYVVVAADYFGKGLSVEGDSYLVKESTQRACVDMLSAARSLLEEMKMKVGPVFLSGWSQGGWATLVFLQKAESLGIAVTATATASAPADVYTTMNRWVNHAQPGDAVYLPAVVALQIQAQERYQQKGLEEIALQPKYRQACRDLYENKIDFKRFREITPAKPSELLRPEFIAAGAVGTTTFWRNAQEAQGYRWRSHTPMHCYYGEKDEVTPVYIAKLPEGFQTIQGGGPTTSISAGAEADHRATFLFAVAEQKKWFDTFLSPPAK